MEQKDIFEQADELNMDLCYQPEAIADISTISEETWHEYRRQGIGGSDAGIIMNGSHFASPLTLYLKKTGLAEEEAVSPEKQYLFDYGHALEPVMAKLFAGITGFQVFKDNNMYRHPLYPFMIADFDYMCYDENGETCGLEIKTSSLSRIGDWHNGVVGEEGRLPYAYECQVRHYLAVRNISHWYVFVSFNNCADQTIIVRVDRDLKVEQTLIEMERRFWIDHVLANNPPAESAVSDSELKTIMESIRTVSEKGTEMYLPDSVTPYLSEYMMLVNEKEEVSKRLKEIGERMNVLSLPIMQTMGDSEKAYLKFDDASRYEVSYATQTRRTVQRKKLEAVYPEVFAQVVNVTTSRPFSVKIRSVRGNQP